jgi:DNA primase
MFPIRDALGRVVGFGGRSLDGAHPKYINSPDTALFSKGRLLYGVDALKHHSKSDPVFVMEGYTDVIMAHQVGVTGCVATLGTALTGEQAKLVSRYSDQVVMVYDGDKAGLQGTEKAAMELLGQGLIGLRVVALPEGRDPCDHFALEGSAGKTNLVSGAKELLDFLLERAIRSEGNPTLEDRRLAAMKLLSAAVRVQDPLTQDLLLGRISERLAIPLSVLREQMRAAATSKLRKLGKPERSQPEPVKVRGAAVARRQILEAFLNDPALLSDWKDRIGPDPRALLGDLGGRLLIRLGELAERGCNQPGLLLDGLTETDLREHALAHLLPEGSSVSYTSQLEGALSSLKLREELEAARNLAANLTSEASEQTLLELQRRYRSMKGRGGGVESS